MLDAVLLAWLAVSPGLQRPVLEEAYGRLRERRWEEAIAAFRLAAAMAPVRAAAYKDLAYTLLRVGETEAAREAFRDAMKIDPGDQRAALEFGFLANETGLVREARATFDRLRKAGGGEAHATAEGAFANIDGPLAEGIARWKKALETGQPSFTVHFELGQLAERRDEIALAAEHYEKAWRMRPEVRSLLVALGRCLKRAGRIEEADTALLAASRAPETRTAEEGSALLYTRYPYVYEFEAAIRLDPANINLRRELAYLHLAMGREAEAEAEFGRILSDAPGDLLSAAQLGFLLLRRKDAAGAMPLLDRVLRGPDEVLADRVRSALALPQLIRRRPETPKREIAAEARLLAEKSYQAGYLKDAAKYFLITHENDPHDYDAILKLGWTHNLLHNDRYAVRWFDLARKSPDPDVAAEAARAHGNLKPLVQRFRFTAWVFPVFSTRWHDLFSYGQVKTEARFGRFPIRPYLSVRLVGDLRGMTRELMPESLSESAAIPAAGFSTPFWHGFGLWGEAGWAAGYRSGKILPDYRGGLTFARGFGRMLGAESGGFFYETNTDAVFLSRFANDTLAYTQHRFGYTLLVGGLRTQWLWNANATADLRRQEWANFAETGPGLKFRFTGLPESMYFTVSAVRGRYMRGVPENRTLMFRDLRAGVWYAFTR